MNTPNSLKTALFRVFGEKVGSYILSRCSDPWLDSLYGREVLDCYDLWLCLNDHYDIRDRDMLEFIEERGKKNRTGTAEACLTIRSRLVHREH
jgi:hypothetical protein